MSQYTENAPGGMIPPDKESRKRKRQYFGVSSLALASMAAFSVATSIGFVGSSIFKDGKQLVDFGLMFAIGVVMFLGLKTLYNYGHDVLPDMQRYKREKIMPAYLAALALTTAVSVSSSAAWVAYPGAAVAQLERQTTEVMDTANRVVAAQRAAESADIALKTTKAQLVAGAESEIGRGAFCGSLRPGRGRCSSVLQSAAVAVNTGQEGLLQAKAQASPTIERILTSQENIRRAMENTDLNYSDRLSAINQEISLLKVYVRRLQGLLPMASVESLSQTLGQEWEAVGLSAVGARKLRNIVNEPSRSLRMLMVDLEEAASLEVASVKQGNPFEVIAEEAGSVFPLIMLAALPDLISLMIIMAAFVARNEDEDEDEEPSASGPLGGTIEQGRGWDHAGAKTASVSRINFPEFGSDHKEFLQ